MIKLEKINGDCYVPLWTTGAPLGDFIKADDGYYVWYPVDNGGCFSQQVLAAILSSLTELNREWDERIRRELSNPEEINE